MTTAGLPPESRFCLCPRTEVTPLQGRTVNATPNPDLTVCQFASSRPTSPLLYLSPHPPRVCVQGYSPQNLANLLWACAKMGCAHDRLLVAAAARAAGLLQQHVAKQGQGQQGQQRGGGGGGGSGGGGGGGLSSQSVSNLTWAFATLGFHPGADFLDQVGAAATGQALEAGGRDRACNDTP